MRERSLHTTEPVATAVRKSSPACAVSACAKRPQAKNLRMFVRWVFAARVRWRAHATLWREGGAPASPLDVISVRLGAPGLRVVEAPALR